jgi:hypothetical protein
VSPRGAIFLSYASQDAEPAKRICESLRAAGFEVWFDRTELRGGDAWDQNIRQQIQSCALFMPVISANTQSRPEGYFRLEWKLAVDRSHLMSDDHPFLVPVVVDDTPDEAARVPPRFRERQWTRLPRGETSPDFCKLVARLINREPAVESAPSRAPAGSIGKRKIHRITILLTASLVVAVTVLGTQAWLRRVKFEAGASTASSASTQSQVNDLLARAAEANRGSEDRVSSREALDSAAKLLDQAKSLDPLNGEIWAKEALNDLLYLADAVDLSAERKNRVIAEVDRALALAPQSFDARMAHALEFYYVLNSDKALPSAERELRALLAEAPGNRKIMATLGFVLRVEERPKEAAAVLMQANLPGEAAWEYLHAADWKGMDAAADMALKLDPLNMDPKLQAELYGFEDADAVRRILDTLPPQEMLKDYPLSFALNYRYMLRDPQKMLEITNSFPREWISSWYYLEPKALWEGNAYRLLGRLDAANAKWRVALKEVQDRLTTSPNDTHLVLLQSDVESALGMNDESAASLRLYEQMQVASTTSPYGDDDLRWMAVKLRLGQRDEAMRWLEANLRHPKLNNAALHGHVRFRPDLDPLRTDASFQKLMRETKPDVAKSLD